MTHLGQLTEKLSVVYPWSERQRTAVVMGGGIKMAARVLEGELTMANLNILLTRPNTGDLWLLLNTADCYFPKRITF